MKRLFARTPTLLLLLVSLPLATACASTAPESMAARATPSDADVADAPDAQTEAVRRALADAEAGAPYHLVVHCTDEQRTRSLELFPEGAGIWKADTQVRVPENVQRDLVSILQESGFAGFAAKYGGKESQNGPAVDEASAPLTIRCRVTFASGEVSKTSIQDLYGEQFAGLLDLGAALLDRVEPLAADGVTAESLADGLEKLAEGTLAPQVFELRFVDLPAPGGDGTGFILGAEDGALSRRPYAPGEKIGEARSRQLDPATLERLVTALLEAGFSDLPTNLYAEDQLELNVQVLGHRKAILARPFRGMAAEGAGDAQQRFEKLVETLRATDVD